MAAALTWKQIKRSLVILIVLLSVGGVGELLRRHWDREQEKTIRRALVHARSTGGSPEEVEPDWDRLKASLRSRLESDPTGSLALLAHTAAARVSLNVPRAFSLAERPAIPVTYGDRPVDEIPVPDESYLWIADIEASWNRGPWMELGRGSWGPDGASHGEIDVAAAVPDDLAVPGWATLRLRMLLRLYVGEHAIAASRASSPEELARVPAQHQQRRSFGGYRVNLLVLDSGPDSPVR